MTDLTFIQRMSAWHHTVKNLNKSIYVNCVLIQNKKVPSLLSHSAQRKAMFDNIKYKTQNIAHLSVMLHK